MKKFNKEQKKIRMVLSYALRLYLLVNIAQVSLELDLALLRKIESSIKII
jgi:hypothetical protein